MNAASDAHAALMDRNYRLQRHVYDLTRRHYLLGRDRLIEALKPPAGGTVLEMGSGTASNLIAAATRHPDARFYGIDISSKMLETARAALARHDLSDRVTLRLADAATLDARACFGVERFDRVFFSYSLSMIPDWRAALHAAFAHVKQGGTLHIVDFGSMDGLPSLARQALRMWLGHFSVTPRDELRTALATIADDNSATLRFSPLWRGYACYAAVARA
ncbi:MAG: methyltransferase [Rhizobiales bacterium 65-9]|nr:class I SAM-dependent methyltransferase [Hyphomicrobiales bacterium]OJY37244.1 MAG: methyltransferase [Rhizobiales bacterium 65-9]